MQTVEQESKTRHAATAEVAMYGGCEKSIGTHELPEQITSLRLRSCDAHFRLVAYTHANAREMIAGLRETLDRWERIIDDREGELALQAPAAETVLA